VIESDGQHSWTGAELMSDERWRIDATPALESDLAALLAWATEREEPLREIQASSLSLPGFDQVVAQARGALGTDGLGAALISGLPSDPDLAQLTYLAIACRLGDPLKNYGRLYDVRDQGGSYLDAPIPVSQTRHTTSFHTDSARRETLPKIVSLLCLQDARGGDSQLVSASRVHEEMQREAPLLLDRLYQDYIRDIVTPGTESTEEALLANRFPVFQSRRDGTGLNFRYMRYWIEKGAERAGRGLESIDLEALDLLDSLLADRSLYAQLHLQPGEALFIDNRDIAHNRTPYVDHPGKSRHLVRMWLTDERVA
jgi:hypothetical protein